VGGETVAQCSGTTKKGDQCKRDAQDGADYCAIHQDQEVRKRQPREESEWDNDAILKAVIGFAIIGLFFMFRRR
jgi:hypothetical protein